MDDDTTIRTWSFVALLSGSLLILVGSLTGAFMMGAWGAWGMMPMAGMMGEYMSSYVGDGWASSMAWWMAAWGILTGGLVLAAALQVRSGRESQTWAVIAIVAGVLSLFALGGYVVGAVAAIVGGALALQPAQRPQRPVPPRSV